MYNRDGASRCGLYCAANFLIEKAQAEKDVDVFLAARYVYINRTQFIRDKVKAVNSFFIYSHSYCKGGHLMHDLKNH